MVQPASLRLRVLNLGADVLDVLTRLVEVLRLGLALPTTDTVEQVGVVLQVARRVRQRVRLRIERSRDADEDSGDAGGRRRVVEALRGAKRRRAAGESGSALARQLRNAGTSGTGRCWPNKRILQ